MMHRSLYYSRPLVNSCCLISLLLAGCDTARLELALGARLYKTEDRVKAHLGKGGETVGGAACIGHDFVLCGIIELLVDSHDKHLSV